MLKRRVALFAIDVVLTFVSGLVALFFRFGFDYASILKYFPAVATGIVIYALSYIFNGIYRVVWAYADAKDMFKIVRAAAIAYLIHIAIFTGV